MMITRLDEREYRRNVLASLSDQVERDLLSDPFFVVDLPIEVDDNELIEQRLKVLYALWTRERSYTSVAQQLVRGRDQLKRELLEDRAETADRVRELRRRHETSDRTPPESNRANTTGAEKLVAAQVQQSLNHFARLAHAPRQAANLFAFLQLTHEATEEDIRLRRSKVAEENRTESYLDLRTVTAELLAYVDSQLLRDQATRDAYRNRTHPSSHSPSTDEPEALATSPASVVFGTMKPGQRGQVVTLIVRGGPLPGNVEDEFVIEPMVGEFWQVIRIGRPQGATPTASELIEIAIEADIPADISPGPHADEIRLSSIGGLATIPISVSIIALPSVASDEIRRGFMADMVRYGALLFLSALRGGIFGALCGIAAGAAAGAIIWVTHYPSYPDTHRPAAALFQVPFWILFGLLTEVGAIRGCVRLQRTKAGEHDATPHIRALTYAAILALLFIGATIGLSQSGVFASQSLPAALPGSHFTSAVGGSSSGTSASGNSDNAAFVSTIKTKGRTVIVPFLATGGNNLHDASTACIWVYEAGQSSPQYTLAPIEQNLLVGEAGHYGGTVTFPLIMPGQYEFQYNCGVYGSIDIGNFSAPIVGVSDNHQSGQNWSMPAYFFAIITSPKDVANGGMKVDFDAMVPPASFGDHLNNPCLVQSPGDGHVLQYGRLSVNYEVSGYNVIYDSGTITFDRAQKGALQYSCQDYTQVPLG